MILMIMTMIGRAFESQQAINSDNFNGIKENSIPLSGIFMDLMTF